MGETKDPYADVVTRAWDDAAFRQRLKSDPKSVLKEAGFSDDGFAGRIEVLANDEKTIYLVLPEKPAQLPPSGDKLSDAQLESVAGGQNWGPPPSPYSYPYPYPAPYPYPYPYPYAGPVVIGDPNYTPGPTLLNGQWHF